MTQRVRMHSGSGDNVVGSRRHDTVPVLAFDEESFIVELLRPWLKSQLFVACFCALTMVRGGGGGSSSEYARTHARTRWLPLCEGVCTRQERAHI